VQSFFRTTRFPASVFDRDLRVDLMNQYGPRKPNRGLNQLQLVPVSKEQRHLKVQTKIDPPD